jgi:transposase
MAWTELTRRQHDRAGDKYASDLTDAEWAIIQPLLPAHKTTGRPRTTRLAISGFADPKGPARQSAMLIRRRTTAVAAISQC